MIQNNQTTKTKGKEELSNFLYNVLMKKKNPLRKMAKVLDLSQGYMTCFAYVNLRHSFTNIEAKNYLDIRGKNFSMVNKQFILISSVQLNLAIFTIYIVFSTP